MAIRFICPHCGHIMHVADQLDGRQGSCANCGRFAMIQGQHLPDGSVGQLVDIATEPERPRGGGAAAAAASAEFASRAARAGGPSSGFSGSGYGAVPGAMAAGRSAVAPGLAPRSLPGSSARVSASAYGQQPVAADPYADAATEPAGDPYADEGEYPADEDRGVGIKTLLLSVLGGAAAAGVIGIVLYLIVLKTQQPPPPPPAVAPTPAVEYTGPIYRFGVSGKVAVLFHLKPDERAGELDHVRSELKEFLNAVYRKQMEVSEVHFALPAQEGEKPVVFSGKGEGQDLSQALGWLEQKLIPVAHADPLPATKALLEKSPDCLVILSEKEIDDAFVKEVAGLLKGKQIKVYGVSLFTDDALRGLNKLNQFRNVRSQDRGPRVYGTALQ